MTGVSSCLANLLASRPRLCDITRKIYLARKLADAPPALHSDGTSRLLGNSTRACSVRLLMQHFSLVRDAEII